MAAVALELGPALAYVDATTSPPESPRLTRTLGLSTLSNVRKAHDLDQKRAQASIGLMKSMEKFVASKSPKLTWESEATEGWNSESMDMARRSTRKSLSHSSTMFRSPRSSGVVDRKVTNDGISLNLQEAFLAHSAAFDLDGDGSICVEELIIIFERCSLFDDFFTANKVRNYFNTWAEGCNRMQKNMVVETESIGYKEFKMVLMWGADMKGHDFNRCAERVIRLSRKVCDKASSTQKRLEVIFDAFCKKNPDRMSAFEFGTLCQKVGVYCDKFSMADVYSLFYKISGVVHGEGVAFDGFIGVMREIGKRLELSDPEEIFEIFAKAVELLDTDEETIIRVRMRLKQAAGIVGGSDWQLYFRELGDLDWDDFLHMCHNKLHLADKDSHLRILFDKLDEDGSGILEADELINFIAA